jgi:hypothetical protein
MDIGMKYVKRLQLMVVILVLFVGGAALWDVVSGPGETWTNYRTQSQIDLGQYPSHESCALEMERSREPTGCRRVDGPFALLNVVADTVFGWMDRRDRDDLDYQPAE